eukprot:432484-Rhodomonas_salina.3
MACRQGERGGTLMYVLYEGKAEAMQYSARTGEMKSVGFFRYTPLCTSSSSASWTRHAVDLSCAKITCSRVEQQGRCVRGWRGAQERGVRGVSFREE